MNQEPNSRRAATADAREGISRLQAGEDVNPPHRCGPAPERRERAHARVMAVFCHGHVTNRPHTLHAAPTTATFARHSRTAPLGGT